MMSLLCNLFVSPPCSFILIPSAQTPIEEFTPTPAFPALQYLESVDEGGVAWRAGLRMGDFLIEVKAGCISG